MGLVELTETFTWEGRRIAWARAGSGPAVVFCHGTPFSSRVWAPYAAALADRFTVHLWDLPGYGRSSMDPEHRVAADVHAQAFKALLDHWGLDHPEVVAHDLGGLVSLRALLVEGAAYASLFLVDVVAIPPSGSPFFTFVQDNPALLPQLPAYIHEAVVRAYVGNATYCGLSPEDLDALVEPWTGPEGQPAFYRQIADYDLELLHENERQLPRLDLPVRVLWGTEDTWIPLETGRRLAGLVPGAVLTEVPEAGHLMQYDAPVALATALRAWLDPTA
jgi:pimeloyl-ACP methyl ester carboxylesterase